MNQHLATCQVRYTVVPVFVARPKVAARDRIDDDALQDVRHRILLRIRPTSIRTVLFLYKFTLVPASWPKGRPASFARFGG
jgi:hypothetical protein